MRSRHQIDDRVRVANASTSGCPFDVNTMVSVIDVGIGWVKVTDGYISWFFAPERLKPLHYDSSLMKVLREKA